MVHYLKSNFFNYSYCNIILVCLKQNDINKGKYKEIPIKRLLIALLSIATFAQVIADGCQCVEA